MARTTTFPLSRILLSLTAVAMLAGGCTDPKDQRIAELTAENERLMDKLGESDRQLNDALVRENDARGSIQRLNDEMARLRADAEKSKETDGWVTMPSFDMISLPGSVLFASGKADLTSQGRTALSKIASDIRARYADRDIYVFGHTDDQPIRKSKWKDNWELGAHRSLTVIRSLRDMGIANEQLVQASCSEFRPRSGNRAENRRVEFYAVKRSPSVIDRTTLSSTGDEN